MTELADLTQRLLARHTLTDGEIASAAAALAAESTRDDDKAAFLIALAEKGETASEVAAFAREFRARAVDPGLSPWSAEAVDIVGTGGDHAGGFNISSLVVLVLASAGVKVMKHGNRGITSRCGSADLLAALGVKLDAPPAKVSQALEQLGFCFLFAPAYHPAFKHIAPVRKTLAAQGRRSVFNILGPLVNPGRPAHVLLGVYSAPWVPRLAEVLDLLGTSAGLAVHGVIAPDRGIDELTTATPNRVRGFGRLRDVDDTWEPSAFGFNRAPFSEIQGGDVIENLAIVDAVLEGKGPAGLVDTIVFNAATALWICNRAPSVQAAIGEARERLLGGSVKAKIAATREFFLA